MLIGSGLHRSGAKREEILGAARALFLREGYADAGMEFVARAAGVSTATLYAYFPSNIGKQQHHANANNMAANFKVIHLFSQTKISNTYYLVMLVSSSSLLAEIVTITIK